MPERVEPTPGQPARVVVLVSGSGTLLDAAERLDFPVNVVAVGADRTGVERLARAERAGVPGFVVRLDDHPDRAAWDVALTSAVVEHEPDLVVSAGFLKILGPAFLDRFAGRVLNVHPALAHGVKVTGCTVHLVDAGVDTGPIVAQEAVAIEPGEDADQLRERIKVVARQLLVDVIERIARKGYTVNGREVSIP